MRDASDDPSRDGFTCDACRRFIVTAVEGLFTTPNPGSKRRFCSPRCRQAAYRRRLANAPEDTPPQRHGGRGRRLEPEPDR